MNILVFILLSQQFLYAVIQRYLWGVVKKALYSTCVCKLGNMTVSAVRFFSVYGWHEEAKKEYANLVTIKFLTRMYVGKLS